MLSPRLSMGIVWLAAVLLAACGGGGGGGDGGGGASSGGNPVIPAGPNVQTIAVEQGPAGTNVVNALYTTVTVCIPGTDTCQAIDHVMVDTGSNGLRIMASVLNQNMVLPLEHDNSNQDIAECTQFADGFTWGPVKLADVRISGEQARSVPIQVIADPDPEFNVIPDECKTSNAPENTVADFGANGLIGVGLFKADCGTLCNSNGNGFYYTCTASSPCADDSTSVAMPENLQVQNPVASFANDNNGILIQLPSPPAAGAVSLTGAMVFGIGTQSNNGLGTARVYTVDDATGMFTTRFKDQDFTQSLLDSGSSVLFFADPDAVPGTSNPVIPVCSDNGFYCPSSPLPLSGIVTGLNNAQATLNFQVANADALLANHSLWAFNNLAAPAGNNSFIWGLPAFMGRKVFVAIESQNVPKAGAGPFFAF
jgi:hypothetical protein